MSARFDIAIIGAGVAGCAIARELALRNPEKSIIVLEKLPGVGLETSSKNSGVLHSGLHQNPDFLKSKLARIGNVLATEYVKTKELPILECGMIVAVPWNAVKSGLWRELDSFFALLSRGSEQDIKFRFLGPWGLKKLEPNLRAMGGIFIPNVSVIDSRRFVEALQSDAETSGVNFFFQSPVLEIKADQSVYTLRTPSDAIAAKCVINAAGLYADEIARLAGFNQYKIYPWRGEYYEVVGEKARLTKRLIYPVVAHNSPGKGIHFSSRVDGRLYIGPNARPVPRKDCYEEDKTPVATFLAAARRFVPEIEAKDLVWAYSGIRPKTTNEAEETDFIIQMERRSPLFINLIGIESPGLSSSMAIAKYVAEMLKSSS